MSGRKIIVVILVGILGFAVYRWNQPMIFGKVVDQHGAPVPGARVIVNFITLFDRGDSNGETLVTDSEGRFEVERKIVIAVGLSTDKGGYYRVSGDGRSGTPASTKMVRYFGGDEVAKSCSRREKPVEIMLFEIGETEDVKYRKISEKIPTNGEAVKVPLAAGSEFRDHSVYVKCIRNIDSAKDLGKLYDWEFELSVPDGGFVERKGQLDFDAPEEGYEPTIRFVFPKDDPKKWKPGIHRSYFVRFADGTHARWSMEMRSGRQISLSGEVYYNPKVGSRNLRVAQTGR